MKSIFGIWAILSLVLVYERPALTSPISLQGLTSYSFELHFELDQTFPQGTLHVQRQHFGLHAADLHSAHFPPQHVALTPDHHLLASGKFLLNNPHVMPTDKLSPLTQDLATQKPWSLLLQDYSNPLHYKTFLANPIFDCRHCNFNVDFLVSLVLPNKTQKPVLWIKQMKPVNNRLEWNFELRSHQLLGKLFLLHGSWYYEELDFDSEVPKSTLLLLISELERRQTLTHKILSVQQRLHGLKDTFIQSILSQSFSETFLTDLDSVQEDITYAARMVGPQAIEGSLYTKAKVLYTDLFTLKQKVEFRAQTAIKP